MSRQNDLIKRGWLEDAFDNLCCHNCKICRNFRIEDSFYKCALINNAPKVEPPEWQFEFVKMLYEKARPQGEWIPVNKKLPDDLETVSITYINHEPEPYYKEIKDKPFTAPAVYFNGQWYWWSSTCKDILAEYSNNFDDVIDRAIEVIAWQPLPEPYKKAVQNE